MNAGIQVRKEVSVRIDAHLLSHPPTCSDRQFRFAAYYRTLLTTTSLASSRHIRSIPVAFAS